MATVYDVAAYILKECGIISTMKLQKLTYYCQAWSLAWDGVPLFEEEFQAWANGPVCPQLYNRHRGLFEIGIEAFGDREFSFTKDETETIHAVLKYYKDESPHYLSELTHLERPWKETRGNIPAGEPSQRVIPKELMQEYYAGL